jgi:hypothetical protein
MESIAVEQSSNTPCRQTKPKTMIQYLYEKCRGIDNEIQYTAVMNDNKKLMFTCTCVIQVRRKTVHKIYAFLIGYNIQWKWCNKEGCKTANG